MALGETSTYRVVNRKGVIVRKTQSLTSTKEAELAYGAEVRILEERSVSKEKPRAMIARLDGTVLGWVTFLPKFLAEVTPRGAADPPTAPEPRASDSSASARRARDTTQALLAKGRSYLGECRRSSGGRGFHPAEFRADETALELGDACDSVAAAAAAATESHASPSSRAVSSARNSAG